MEHDRHHKHEKHDLKIYVESQEYDWDKSTITYAEVVTLEFPTYPQNPQITYSVKYTHGPAKNPSGVLPPRAEIEVKNGMRFRVTDTGES